MGTVTFKQCLAECAATPELVAEFDRLTGHNLSRRGSKLDIQIDDATGRTDAGLKAFIEFVHEFVWERLPEEAKAA